LRNVQAQTQAANVGLISLTEVQNTNSFQ
jgi:hypothetical protein